jgi:hypothetical protein
VWLTRRARWLLGVGVEGDRDGNGEGLFSVDDLTPLGLLKISWTVAETLTIPSTLPQSSPLLKPCQYTKYGIIPAYITKSQ